MKKHETLESAKTPDGTLLTLHRHDGTYAIKADGVELMSSRKHASEDRLAELVCEPLAQAGVRQPKVLIGGLGLGFTLRAALGVLPADARVVVAEIMPEVVRWNENPDYGISVEALHDPRVEVRVDDVARVMRSSVGEFDGIMLDVDNGAEPISMADNVLLYRVDGIRTAVAALKEGGLLAYWSLGVDAAFERTLRGLGLGVTVTSVRAHGASGPSHPIYVCSRMRTV